MATTRWTGCWSTAFRPVVPVHRLIPYKDPLTAFAGFACDPVAAFLDSAADVGGRGRYSYIAADPFAVITAGETVEVDGKPQNDDPFTVLARELSGRSFAADTTLPPFQTGAVGFLGYELSRHLEQLPPLSEIGVGVPDMLVGLYDTVVAFDVAERRAWVIASDSAGPSHPDRPRVEVRIEALIARMNAAPSSLSEIDWSVSGRWQPEVPRPAFEDMVRRTIEYIYAGDIFQANITQRIIGDKPPGLDPFTLYRRLRTLSPAPYAAHLNGGGCSVLSASPERFLRLYADGRVGTRPIKGTRPRGKTREQDVRLADELLASDKDRAENLMIVDLLRNDLSRVCRIGSVRVDEMFELESFANVHHLVSEVRGWMAPHMGPIDLLRATFPGGSITGTPKIRAMEIINELEPARRGPYCGTIGWIGFDGAMELSIIIRTLVLTGDRVVAQAGGGIVADSDPAAEYDETMDKAGALLASLQPCFNGSWMSP